MGERNPPAMPKMASGFASCMTERIAAVIEMMTKMAKPVEVGMTS